MLQSRDPSSNAGVSTIVTRTDERYPAGRTGGIGGGFIDVRVSKCATVIARRQSWQST
jgi:hypothetical protein